MENILNRTILAIDVNDLPDKPTPNISIRTEEIFNIGGFSVTNGMITTIIAVLLCAAFFAWLASNLQLKPNRKQAVGEFVVESLLGQVEGSLGRRVGRSLFPLLATFFIFIIFANWFSLIPGIGTIGKTEPQIAADNVNTTDVSKDPFAIVSNATTLMTQPNENPAKGSDVASASAVRIDQVVNANLVKVTPVYMEGEGVTTPKEGESSGYIATSQLAPAKLYKILVPYFRAPNADINMTLAMALISIVLVEFLTIRAHGLGGWLKEFFPSLALSWMGPIEIVSHLSRIISLTFRLYGNVFAGEVLLTIILRLTGPVVIVFIALEIFFGFIQALVFFLLSTAYFNLGIIGQGDTHGDEHGDAATPHSGDAAKDVHTEERALQGAGASH